jgi:hypothetical protein
MAQRGEKTVRRVPPYQSTTITNSKPRIKT